MLLDPKDSRGLAAFDRHFLAGGETFTVVGTGSVGGKAAGLRLAREVLDGRPDALRLPELEIAVPTLTVLGTDLFDLFVERNRLAEFLRSTPDDHRIAAVLQRAELPAEVVGDLWALVREVHTPLAVRSSSLLEDALAHPFAGVYATKMIPNNQADAETRFRKLTEAIKFVYASTFFREARAYVRTARRAPEDEKMAVVIQEVVGGRHGARFYPHVSGVARSWNFYPTGSAAPEEGVVDLAFGLGKTIVDGGRAWTYSPRFPQAMPPFNSMRDLLEQTQTEFWAVNMGPPPAYDPTAETEYLARVHIDDAEADGTLAYAASTYDPAADRLILGTGTRGPRVLDFGLLLRAGSWPVNEAVRGLLALFAERLGTAVEIEFALELPAESGRPARLGFLQVRPMLVPTEQVDLDDDALADPRALVRSQHVLGNGRIEGVRDVVYVKPGPFAFSHTRAIAAEVQQLDRALEQEGRPYLLMGFGRWGSADPWLGIPVTWSQIAGARVIVEAGRADRPVDPSHGAHFFHNLLSFHVAYFSVPAAGPDRASNGIDWAWLDAQPARRETAFVRHVELPEELHVRVDGRSRRGVVLRAAEPGP